MWDIDTGKVVARAITGRAVQSLTVNPDETVIAELGKAPEVTALAVTRDGSRLAAENIVGGVQLCAIEPSV